MSRAIHFQRSITTCIMKPLHSTQMYVRWLCKFHVTTTHPILFTTHTSHVPLLIITHPHLTSSTPHHPPPPQVVLLDNSNGLLQYLPAPQVHKELGGSLVYNHDEWIDAQRVSNLLISFCFTLIFLPLLKDVLSTCTRSFLYRPVS